MPNNSRYHLSRYYGQEATAQVDIYRPCEEQQGFGTFNLMLTYSPDVVTPHVVTRSFRWNFGALALRLGSGGPWRGLLFSGE